MNESPKSGYTEVEQNELYDLVDNLASLYFGEDDKSDFESSVLRIAQIIEAKRKRLNGKQAQ
jgi:hypothetical protein